MITRFNDALCGCCGRTATGFGYTPKSGQTILWVCDDVQCLQIAKDSYTMKQDTFTRIESIASGKGGNEGGQFLDDIGVRMFKADGSEMTDGEWFEFCRRIVAGYRKGMVQLLKDEAPF